MSESLAAVAGGLVDEAFLRGSRDNMTVLLMQVMSPLPPLVKNHFWTEKFSKRYIPPILFYNAPGSFTLMVRDELQTLCLDEDLTLSLCDWVGEVKYFPVGMSRAQMNGMLQSALQRQWDNKDSWVWLNDFETSNCNMKRNQNIIIASKNSSNNFWKTLVNKLFICSSKNDRHTQFLDKETQRRRKQRKSASSSLLTGGGNFSKLSSIRGILIMNGTKIVSSGSIDPFGEASRQTSADDNDFN